MVVEILMLWYFGSRRIMPYLENYYRKYKCTALDIFILFFLFTSFNIFLRSSQLQNNLVIIFFCLSKNTEEQRFNVFRA